MRDNLYYSFKVIFYVEFLQEENFSSIENDPNSIMCIEVCFYCREVAPISSSWKNLYFILYLISHSFTLK